MKLNKLFLGGLVALGLLASCKGKEPNKQTRDLQGSTYMSINVNLGESLRAEEGDSYNKLGEWEGRDEIKDITVFLIQGGVVEYKEFTNGSTTGGNTFTESAGKLTTIPWKTTPGAKSVYVVVNGSATTETQAILADLKTKSTKSDFEAAYKAAKEITATETTVSGSTTKDLIMMTGVPVTQTIADGVSATDAPNSATNKVVLSVRRTMSRVTVTRDKALGTAGTEDIEIKNGNRTIGRLKNISWSVGQTSKLTNILWQDVDGGFDFAATLKVKSADPAYSYVPSSGNFKTQAPTYYDYSKLSEQNTLTLFDRATTPTVNEVVKGTMKFITETTHKAPTDLTKGMTGDYRKGNTTYVQIVATFVPESTEWADGESSGYVEGNPIYLGVITGKWYQNEAKAQEANKVSEKDKLAGKDGVIKFATGKMYYYAWLNPNEVLSTKWTLSPVVRNNIYHVNVKGFSKYGFSGNPFNPEGPGPDPDDPTPDPEDPLEDKETYMTTEISVIKWGVHSYDVNF